jgi:hypothetical protein
MAYEEEPMCEICKKEYALFFSFMDTGEGLCGDCCRKELEKNGRT